MSMTSYKIDDIVKLNSGGVVKIINLPTKFMSNGSYEVLDWGGKNNKPFWVKPEDILYLIKKEYVDDINNYFEVIWDEDGLNLIPKDFSSIDIESDREDFNRIKLTYDDGRKHKLVNIHVGGVPINDLQKVTVGPKKIKKGKIDKIIDIIKNKEDEV